MSPLMSQHKTFLVCSFQQMSRFWFDLTTLLSRYRDFELGIPLLSTDVATLIVRCRDISLMSRHSSTTIVTLSVMSRHWNFCSHFSAFMLIFSSFLQISAKHKSR